MSFCVAVAGLLCLTMRPAQAGLLVGANINITKLAGNQTETTVAADQPSTATGSGANCFYRLLKP